jgi:hypothetical protein
VPDKRPSDLMVAATVLGPVREGAASGGGSGRVSGPARYIIEADGCLRAARDVAAGATTFPGRTKQLAAAEVDRLWRQLAASGLLERDAPGRMEGPEEALIPGPRPVALIYVSWDGKRQTVRVVLDRSTPEAMEAERVVERLAGWAWQR